MLSKLRSPLRAPARRAFHSSSSSSRQAVRLPSHKVAIAATTLTTFAAVAISQTASNQALIEEPVPHVSVEELLEEVEEALTDASWFTAISNRLGDAWTAISNGFRYLSRLATILAYASPLAALAPSYYLFGASSPALEELTFGYIIWAVQRLGPCFVKMAQWASTRPDLFPPNLVAYLVRLQDDVHTDYSFDLVEKTLYESLGPNWRDVLVLDPVAIGAGSVAQVFRGILTCAETQGKAMEVAVKVIHPLVKDQVATDMDILGLISNFLDKVPSLEILALGETCREFGVSMNMQLDLRVEAAHLDRFRENFKEDKWAEFPEPIAGFVTKNVLVESMIAGEPISRFMALPDDESDASMEKCLALGLPMAKKPADGWPNGISTHALKMRLSDLGTRAVLKMIFFDNYIHGDLHPGNILVRFDPVTKEPTLGILDCGIVYSSQSDAEHQTLVDICVAFLEHDGRKAGRLMLAKSAHAEREKQISQSVANGVPLPVATSAVRITAEQAAISAANEAAFCEDVHQVVVDSEHQSYFEHMSEYFARVCDTARAHNVRFDPGYFKIVLALKVAEGISLGLNHDMDMITSCLPILAKARTMRAMGLYRFPVAHDDNENLLLEAETKRNMKAAQSAADLSKPKTRSFFGFKF